MPFFVSSSTSAKSAWQIDDETVADDAGDPGMKDAGRDQTQDELRAVDVDGMAGVVSALIPRDDREMWRQQIDDFAFAFIAPLRAEHCQVHNRTTILPANDFSTRARAENARGDASQAKKIFYFQIDNARAAS